MTEHAPVRAPATAPGRRSVVRRAIARRPWLAVLAVYAASRGVSSLLLGGVYLAALLLRLPFPGAGRAPSFATFCAAWDGWYYRSIASHGYPVPLPVDASGHVRHNAWAFLPVYPAVQRTLSAATGLPTSWTGIAVAVVAGGGALILLERLVAPRVGRRRALQAVALLAFGPVGFLLQVAYAESLFLVLALGAALAAERRRPALAAALGVVAAFTRPGAFAVAGALALPVLARWIRDRRAPAGTARALVGAAVVALAAAAWPVVADAVTGRHGAYLDTELSWWTGWVGRPPFVPFTPWVLITARWLGPAGVVAAALLLAALAVWLVRGSPRELSPVVRSSTGVYAVYLLAVFLPQVSLPRLVMPLAPLLAARAFTGTRRRWRTWLTVGLVLQVPAVVLLWWLGYP